MFGTYFECGVSDGYLSLATMNATDISVSYVMTVIILFVNILSIRGIFNHYNQKFKLRKIYATKNNSVVSSKQPQPRNKISRNKESKYKLKQMKKTKHIFFSFGCIFFSFAFFFFWVGICTHFTDAKPKNARKKPKKNMAL